MSIVCEKSRFYWLLGKLSNYRDYSNLFGRKWESVTFASQIWILKAKGRQNQNIPKTKAHFKVPLLLTRPLSHEKYLVHAKKSTNL
jgi:hypothetical protein